MFILLALFIYIDDARSKIVGSIWKKNQNKFEFDFLSNLVQLLMTNIVYLTIICLTTE